MRDVIYGRNPVREALESSKVPLEKIYFQEGSPDEVAVRLRKLAQEKKVPFTFVTKSRLDGLTGRGNHQGVVAKTAARDYMDFSRLLSLPLEKKEPAFFLALFQVQDPHNLGALLRTGECAGLHGIIIPRARSVGLTATVSKVSSGADSYVPVAKVSNLSESLALMKREEIAVIGAHSHEGTDYRLADYRRPLCLVLGGEGRGLDGRILSLCDTVVRIPLKGMISSLNVSVAGGLLLYEVLRQRSA
ncbi:MAG: 23S rRNA (guanosine(2251)-2'-O)-methyltransferase RlmB [Candidatus Eremiobacteraeota bacterium]|nr:23S rRNA (guanosine(2251)-2'-O)-methyltransferase RlmB [Candidatus Eremiobacteraeota bacterium]